MSISWALLLIYLLGLLVASWLMRKEDLPRSFKIFAAVCWPAFVLAAVIWR